MTSPAVLLVDHRKPERHGTSLAEPINGHPARTSETPIRIKRLGRCGQIGPAAELQTFVSEADSFCLKDPRVKVLAEIRTTT